MVQTKRCFPLPVKTSGFMGFTATLHNCNCDSKKGSGEGGETEWDNLRGCQKDSKQCGEVDDSVG